MVNVLRVRTDQTKKNEDERMLFLELNCQVLCYIIGRCHCHGDISVYQNSENFVVWEGHFTFTSTALISSNRKNCGCLERVPRFVAYPAFLFTPRSLSLSASCDSILLNPTLHSTTEPQPTVDTNSLVHSFCLQ